MASLIESNQDFVSYRQPAWHGLGTILQNVLTVDDALKYGGLDFEVEKAPNIHRLPSGIEVISQKSFFTYRTDNERVLGDYVGPKYTILQNHEALSLLDEVVEKGDLEIETAGALSGGAKVFLCARVKKPIVVNGNDESYQYLVLSNGHDGLMSVQAFFTTVRVVCNNTLQLALKNCKNKLSIKHTSQVKSNYNHALKVLGIIEANQQCAIEGYNHLSKIHLSKKQFCEYLGNIFFDDDQIKLLYDKTEFNEVIGTRKIKLLNEVIDYCYTGPGQSEAGEMSAWWAYNGVTGFFNNVKTYKTAEHRMDGLLWGDDADTMTKAIQLAAHPTKVKSIPMDLTKLNFN
jgi:phage/plasmid-like protein (TIGR03299 family)